MDAGHLIAFNLALLAALASPGPALMVAMRATLVAGRPAGIATGAGLGLVAAMWTLAALLGLDALFALFPFAYGAVKVAGAAYLIWIAISTWRAAQQAIGAAPVRTNRAMLSGMLVNLGNPKSVLFAAAVLVVIFPQDLTLSQKALITVNHFAVEFVVYAALAFLLSLTPVRQGYLSLKPAFDRASALVLGALGLRLLTER
ncbi:MAG: LysE family transporter [Pseudomonadota bacterium]